MLLGADSSLVAISATATAIVAFKSSLVLLTGMNGPLLFQIIIFLLSFIDSCVGLYFFDLGRLRYQAI